jgi:hypothetical protein
MKKWDLYLYYQIKVMKLVILFCCLTCIVYGQEGRKNEKSISKKIYGKSISSPWKYHKTQVGEIQESEMPKLFKWNITPNRLEYRNAQEKQRVRRAKLRVRGNEVFHKKKYSF